MCACRHHASSTTASTSPDASRLGVVVYSNIAFGQESMSRVLLVASRGFAKKATRQKGPWTGWDKLVEPLQAVAMPLPNVESLKVRDSGTRAALAAEIPYRPTELTHHSRAQVTFGKRGAGHTGARMFKHLMPALRYHNPEAEIVQRRLDDSEASVSPLVQLKFSDGVERELDVRGQTADQILRQVLQTVGANESSIEQSVQWAAEHTERLSPRKKRGGSGQGADEADAEDLVAQLEAAEGLEALEAERPRQ